MFQNWNLEVLLEWMINMQNRFKIQSNQIHFRNEITIFVLSDSVNPYLFKLYEETKNKSGTQRTTW
jgi:hypothetical protein